MSVAAALGTVRTIGLISHPVRRRDAVIDDIDAWVHARGASLVALDRDIGRGLPVHRLSADELAAELDLVIAVGGDGTILHALRLAAPAGVPVLGVNLGHLGFLAEVEPDELAAALTAIADDRYTVEERLALDARVRVTAAVVPDSTLRAANDIALTRTPGHGQAALEVSVGGQLFTRYVGDGLIVSTPTGSTAYSLSAGGPIVSPAAQALLITPLASHGLLNRSLVVGAGEQVQVDVLPGSSPLVVEVDGARHDEIGAGSGLVASRSAHDSLLVRLGWDGFYGRARRKLQVVDPLELSDAGLLAEPRDRVGFATGPMPDTGSACWGGTPDAVLSPPAAMRLPPHTGTAAESRP